MAKFTCNFISYTLMRTVDITVVVPSPTIPEAMALGFDTSKAVNDPALSGHAPAVKLEPPRHTKAEKYPVVYLLHGMGNNHATWTGYTNVEMYAEERNIAVVMISAENKSYVDQDNSDKFYDFIEHELPDFVCGMFPISDRPEDTYIAGLSMGGFGTFVHGFSNPEKYAAMGTFSAAVELDPSVVAGGAPKAIDPRYDPKTLANGLIRSGKKMPALFIACGEKDFLYRANKAFAEELQAAGQAVTWVSMQGYAHEWRFWNIIVEQFLDWLPRTDSYAQKGRRPI